MLRRRLFLSALVALAVTPVIGTRADEDDHRWERHRERCEALEHEEHELRERREHTYDPEEREHLEHRLREIEAERDEHCRR